MPVLLLLFPNLRPEAVTSVSLAVVLLNAGSGSFAYAKMKRIITEEKIVTSAHFRPMTEVVIIQVLFEENAGKTELTFSIIHPTEEYCKQQEKMGFYNGWGSALERFENTLNSITG